MIEIAKNRMDISVYDKNNIVRCIENLSNEFSMKSYEIVEILTEYYPEIQDFFGGGSYLEELPNEMLFEIIKYLSKNELSRLCTTSRRMSEFCSDPYYTENLTVKDIEVWYFPMTQKRKKHISKIRKKQEEYVPRKPITNLFYVAFGRTGTKTATPLGFWVKNENVSVLNGVASFKTNDWLDLDEEDKA